MMRQMWKVFVLSLGLVAAVSVQPTVARAGIIADTWYAIFGPPGTPYFPGAYTSYYGPTYYAGYYPGAYSGACYRPAPVCCPNPCDPCGGCGPSPCSPCASGACPGGNCETAVAPKSSSPPQTFKKPGPMNEDPPMPDSKFKSRDNSSKFRPTDKSKKSGTNGTGTEFPTPAGDGDADQGTKKTATQREALRVPTGGAANSRGPVIRQKKPAPARKPVEKLDGPKKKELPALIKPNFDDKIAWKPVLPRTRLIINARVTHPQLSRTIVDPNSGWRPVRPDSRIVRK